MPITNESFRPDPRRRVLIRALSGFFIEGRDKAVLEDEIVELPHAQASVMIHSNKAVQYDGPQKPGERVVNPDRERRDLVAAQQLCPACFRPLGDHPATVATAAAAARASADKNPKS